MMRFEGKIKGIEESPSDILEIEGSINGQRCRITIEAPGIIADLTGLYGIEKETIPIIIGNGAEF